MHVAATILASLVVLGSALAAASDPTFTVRFADVTGDGVPDKLIVGSDGSLNVAVHAGRREYVLVPQAVSVRDVVDLFVTDLDGDGRNDLYVLSEADNVALRGDGAGRFMDVTAALGLADGDFSMSAERLDADGDGLDDLLVHDVGGDVLFWATAGGPFEGDADTPPLGTDRGPLASTGGVDIVGSLGGPAFGGPGGILGRRKRYKLGLTAAQQEILSCMSVVDLDDGFGNPLKTIRFSGCNVQIVNGLGATNGFPADPDSVDSQVTAVNGLGNLIVGYNEVRPVLPDDRTGSHNIVLGQEHNYSSFGGLVGGDNSNAQAPYASIVGGWRNWALGARSVVVSGQENFANGADSVVVSGSFNAAAGSATAVVSGTDNQTSGSWSAILSGISNQATVAGACVAGGNNNRAQAQSAFVGGGEDNRATGSASAILGGIFNQSPGIRTAIAGGNNNRSQNSESVVLGGFSNVASGSWAVVTGGWVNTASGQASTCGGGANRVASGTDDWVAGSLFENN